MLENNNNIQLNKIWIRKTNIVCVHINIDKYEYTLAHIS